MFSSFTVRIRCAASGMRRRPDVVARSLAGVGEARALCEGNHANILSYVKSLKNMSYPELR
jgi:hypothetical protein